MNSGAIIGIFGALITLATVAVLVSQKAQTASVLQAFGSAAGGAITAAVSPVVGAANPI